MQKENSELVTSTPKLKSLTVKDFMKHKRRRLFPPSKNHRGEENSAMFTSTPKPKNLRKGVLKENQDSNSPEEGTKLEEKRLAYGKPQKFDVAKGKPNRKSSKSNAIDEKFEAKRRLKALEAMKILEQRRLRMTQDNVNAESITDDLDKCILNTPPSDDSPETKKRNEAKALKEKRIREFLAEQEARKNKAETKPKMITSQHANIPQLVPFNPRRVVFNMAYQIPERTMKNQPIFKRPIIKYTMDEIRSLNPYGYYFM